MKKQINIVRPLIVTVAAALFLTVGVSQDFAFMPKGGSQLLLEVSENCSSCDDLGTLLTADRSQEEWRAYFNEQEGALEGLTESQVNTLVAYLALSAPVAKSELPESGKIDKSALPIDGRLLALQQCMICHSIARPITQSWSLEQWVAHFEGPTHSTIGMPDTVMLKIAHYLANNTLPLEDVPAALRGNTPGY